MKSRKSDAQNASAGNPTSVSEPMEEETNVKPETEGTTAPPSPVRTSPPNHIFIGKKPVMSYAMSALIQLSHSGEVVLMARGMVISRAVDVAEIVTKRLGNNAYEVKDIKTDTEKMGTGDDIRSVSTIVITVGKK